MKGRCRRRRKEDADVSYVDGDVALK